MSQTYCAIFILLICKCILVENVINTVPFIISGNDGIDGQFPYMVSIRSYGSHFCGGSIINERWILTAAHCIIDITSVDGIDVVIGTNSLKTGGVTIKVEKRITHEYYTTFFTIVKNDIGLLKLKTPITFNDVIKPIKICTSQPSAGSTAILSGWGLLRADDKTLPDRLQYLNYKIVSWFTCFLNNFPYDIWCRYICAQGPSNSGVCHGDSGSPLIVNDQQIGVLSWTVGCYVGKPDAYANVCVFNSWITDKIKTL